MKKFKIIVVENDADERFFINEGFEKTGLFDVITIVKNGDVLFEFLDKNKEVIPDLILSDLNMPGKNGYDVITEVQNTERLAEVPVFITSTSSTPSIIEKCMEVGAAGYMVKPETFIDYEPFIKELYEKLSMLQPK